MRLGAPLLLIACALSACAVTGPGAAPAPAPTAATMAAHDVFFLQLRAQCGRAFPGRLVSNDAADAAFAGVPLVLEVRRCSDTELQMPFHVGEDRSRVFVLTRTIDGLEFRHDHRHEDGKPDTRTLYGGYSEAPGTQGVQRFPADAQSKDLFLAEGLTAAVDNVWTLEVTDAQIAYSLQRPNRHFRVEFSLSERLAPPPPPWAEAPVK